MIGRYHRFVKNVITALTKIHKESRQIKYEAVKNPSLTSGELFKRIGETTVSRIVRCHLKKVELPPLQRKRGNWKTKLIIEFCIIGQEIHSPLEGGAVEREEEEGGVKSPKKKLAKRSALHAEGAEGEGEGEDANFLYNEKN
ncbi:Hypothetical predicted protein [Octopus vulgaris]|uniref:Uncharacterized protein n=1 Tax=Octopus vulgaris TaxID=6645 RepID=A0AA36FDW7_OCTVU|nr:Hypothetical predicted protein [Octopus vulgaris]